MKKLIASITCGLIAASCFAITASAEVDYKGVKLPFKVEAPVNVAVNYIGDTTDSLTTCKIAYSTPKDMNAWLSAAADYTTHDQTIEKLSTEYGLSEIAVTAQIDWAIDDPENGWHYTPYWDGETYTDDEGRKIWAGFGHDKDYQTRVGEWDYVEEGVDSNEAVTDKWILRDPTLYDPNAENYYEGDNDWFYGNDLIPGLKNQLKDDQYELVVIEEGSNEKTIFIDFTKHTLYTRVRFAVTVWTESDYNESFPIFSDWSATASTGKDAEKFTPYTKETLKAPVISNLRYYEEEFNGYPQIAVTLTVPEELTKNATVIEANGGTVYPEWEARVPGGEWVRLQGGQEITSGELVLALQHLAEDIIRQNSENGVSTGETVLAKDSPIELRGRYFCSQYDGYNGEWLDDFYSDYSEVLTFGSQEMSHTEASAPAESSVKESAPSSAQVESAITEAAQGFANMFLIIIIIIIAVVLLIIAAVVVIIIVVVNKKKKKNNNNNNNNNVPPAAPMQ